MNTKTIIWVAGGGVALYLLSKSGVASRLSPITANVPGSVLPSTYPGGNTVFNPTITTGAPAPPATYSQQYYEAYEYPAMKAVNPNVVNSSYALTNSEADQYLNNYNDINQWSSTVVPKQFSTKEDAARYHWLHYGPSEKRTFMPLIPQDLSAYVPAPANPSSSGGGFLGTVKKVTGVVGSLLAILGIDERLSDEEAKLVIQGAAFMEEVLPFYKQSDPRLYNAIVTKMDALVAQYTAQL